jgi:hypothetical protein
LIIGAAHTIVRVSKLGQWRHGVGSWADNVLLRITKQLLCYLQGSSNWRAFSLHRPHSLWRSLGASGPSLILMRFRFTVARVNNLCSTAQRARGRPTHGRLPPDAWCSAHINNSHRAIIATDFATQLSGDWVAMGGIATFIVAIKKEPQAEYALGVLVD